MKKLVFTALALLAALGAIQIATPAAKANNCDNVRCAACANPNEHPKLTPPDCCTCVPN
jgi:hypothetical protein